VARFVVGAVFGLVVGVVGAAALGIHASDDTERTDQIHHAAAEAGVDETDLAGAVNSTGLDPFVYLRGVGELDHASSSSRPPVSVVASAAPAVSARVACIIRVESCGDPNARNRSGASGLGQFLPSTWATTPQGRAGLSVFNAADNTAAIQWMIDVGRAREFDAVRFYGC